MVQSCSAFGCSTRFNKKDGIGFFYFPKEKTRLIKWLYALRRKDWMPSRTSRICGKHFVTGRVNHDPKHPDYVPSIFNFSERPKKKRKKWTRRIHPQENQNRNTSTIPDPPQSTSTDEVNPSSSSNYISGMDEYHPYLMLDVSSWPSKTQSTVPVIFLRKSSTRDEVSSAIHQTYDNSADQMQPDELYDDSDPVNDADQMQSDELYDDSDPVNDADQMQPDELYDSDPVNDDDDVTKSCDECEHLKALVEKMSTKIAGLELERKFYKEKSIMLEESIEECLNTKELLKKMDHELNTLRIERDNYKEQVRDYAEQVFSSPRMLYFYTGLNRPTIDWILEFARKNEPQGEFLFLSVETQLLLVLMKLRLGLLYRDLAYRFKTSMQTVSRAFNLWLPILGPKLCTLKQGKGDEIHFPRYLRKSVKNCMGMLGKKRHERKRDDADSENTLSADEESVGDPTENDNVVVERIDNTFQELDATNSVRKADDNNFAGKFVGNSAEVSEATKSLEQILNDSSTDGLVSDPTEEATESLQQIIGNKSSEELSVNSPNVFYIINSAENSESADQSKIDNPVEATDKTDSTKEDPANNCTEVYYIINTTEEINNSDDVEPPHDSNLPEDVIFLI